MLHELPNNVASAIAPEIRPLSIKMSDMSATRLAAARKSHHNITLTNERIAASTSAVHPFPRYNWRPFGVEIGEIAASNGNPNEFCTNVVGSVSTSLVQRAATFRSHTASAMSTARIVASRMQSSGTSSHAPGAAGEYCFSPGSIAASRFGSSLRRQQPQRVASRLSEAARSASAYSSAADAHKYPSLLSHLESAVPAELRELGVTFADARTASLELHYNATVRGFSDAAALHPHRARVIGRVISDLAFSLVLFDWKTPETLLPSNAVKVESQLCSQAIAFREEYGYSVPVVATDLSTSIRVWSLEGDLLSEYLNTRGTDLSLDEGMHLVWRLMQDQLKLVSGWREAKKRVCSIDDDDSGPPSCLSDTYVRGQRFTETTSPCKGTGDEVTDGFCGRGGGGGGGGTHDFLLGKSVDAVGAHTDSAKHTSISEAEANLYDDLERERIAQRVAAVWNNSSSLQGLMTQLAMAERV